MVCCSVAVVATMEGWVLSSDSVSVGGTQITIKVRLDTHATSEKDVASVCKEESRLNIKAIAQLIPLILRFAYVKYSAKNYHSTE